MGACPYACHQEYSVGANFVFALLLVFAKQVNPRHLITEAGG